MKWIACLVSDEMWELLVSKDGEPHDYTLRGDAAFELDDGEYWIDKFAVPVIKLDLEVDDEDDDEMSWYQ